MMAGDLAPIPIQLIDGAGVFNVAGLRDFVETVRTEWDERRRSYAVVSILGPRSSGKSTLLNHLFGTNFGKTNGGSANLSRPEATRKGVWLATSGVEGQFTVVLDLDGNYGTKRKLLPGTKRKLLPGTKRKDGNTFETQSALFALAVSDIVLINMWCHDIGNKRASIKPLVKTLFKHVITRFHKGLNPRKTTLLFIIRDKNERPLEKLEDDLRKDIQKIWDSASKRLEHKQNSLSEFFDVKVVAFSSYVKDQEHFKAEVKDLRQRLFHRPSAPGELANDHRGIIPASGFAFSAQEIWKCITDNKDLDVDALKSRVIYATDRCEEIANLTISFMSANEDWRSLDEASQVQMVPGFGKKLSTILDECLSRYQTNVYDIDETIRTWNRKQLVSKLLQISYPAYQSMLGYIQSKTLDDFKKTFDEALVKGKESFRDAARKCTQSFLVEFDKRVQDDAVIRHANWNPSEVKDKLHCDMDAHVASVHATKLNELTMQYKAYINKNLAECIAGHLDAANDDTWPAIRELFQGVTGSYKSEFSSALSAYDPDQATEIKMIAELEEYAKGVVKSKASYEPGNILKHMKDRFSTFFSHNAGYKPRVEGKKEDIKEIIKIAHYACLKLLSVRAAVRLDDKADNIEKILSHSLVEDTNFCDPLDSNTWDEVSPVDILIPPVQCKDLWKQFKEGTENIVTSAIKAQEMETGNEGNSSQVVNNVHQIFEMADDGCSLQVINKDGDFNLNGLNHFVETLKMTECGLSYVVVSIMGPQSSGKSTLLNHLFGTNFVEMDALRGRSQTTKGIWLARCASIEPFTVVMDLEGTDGNERGEDDTTFERQSALFALAVSDVVIINMWCHDIGREHGANMPLLRTIFQVIKGLFSPRKTTLLFVMRDKTKTPIETLERILMKDIQEIWDNVPNPPAHKPTCFGEAFNMEVVALSSYEENEELFKEEVARIRQRFHDSITPGGLAGNRRGVVRASLFPFTAHRIWEVIKESKDLWLPTHKVMVATVRCEEIANEKISSMTTDKEWRELETLSQQKMVPGFGKKVSEILDRYLSRYDMEASDFDEAVRITKRKQLKSELLQIVNPTYQSILGHIQSKTLDDFKEALNEVLVDGKVGFADAALKCSEQFLSEFDRRVNEDATIKHANWDPSNVRHKLRGDVEAHVSSILYAKLDEYTSQHKKALDNELEEPVKRLLAAANGDTWRDIRKLLQEKTRSCMPQELACKLSVFDPDQDTLDKMSKDLLQHAKSSVESVARDVAKMVLFIMKNRFAKIFSERSIFETKEDVETTAKTAHSECLKLLSILAAVRWDDQADGIENTLSRALIDGEDPDLANSRVQTVGLLASNTWDKVSPEKTLISPFRCQDLWRQFKEETEYIVKVHLTPLVMGTNDDGSPCEEDESDETDSDGENKSGEQSADNFNHGNVLEGSPVSSIEEPCRLANQDVEETLELVNKGMETADMGSPSQEVTFVVEDESDEKSADNFNHDNVVEGFPVTRIGKPSPRANQEVEEALELKDKGKERGDMGNTCQEVTSHMENEIDSADSFNHCYMLGGSLVNSFENLSSLANKEVEETIESIDKSMDADDVGRPSQEVTTNVEVETDENSADGQNKSVEESAENFNHSHLLEGSPVNSIEKPSLLVIKK